ncbi:hypothetical protein I350_07397 [Cryptococcus amylolentus CBS 6273]|uniref:Deoxycytidylate deaminase n=1 Tax=Cryptococcus amylolentus CBS 6273 TaxID=1296118 RepID=A0A1E3JEC6_9TREE|nr:hypothetical protein I350_07397 [Cryptococcus amylolentus CBS 6273]
MFIAIIGTPSAGKKVVLQYLEKKYGFQRLRLAKDQPQEEDLSGRIAKIDVNGDGQVAAAHTYANANDLLDFVTHNWLSHFVTTDLTSFDDVEPFVKRPFFLLVSVNGPLIVRYERERARAESLKQTLSLEKFITDHDALLHGPPPPQTSSLPTLAHMQLQSDFRRVLDLAHIQVNNNFTDISALHWYLDRLDLLDEGRLRPGWDRYFMTLASLASHRSNCMKRRVGALLVRSKRILSTGYNGTPRGVRNCNQGGCSRCNGSARGGEALNECLCLHAEENALLEAGRDRIGDDSVIYCNTCPCLRCSVKIVQCGVREVVYNQSYSMDEASAMVLKEGGVILRQLSMPEAV